MKDLALTKNTLPTLEELVNDTDLAVKTNQLMILLNQPVPDKWLKDHPTAKVKIDGVNKPARYMPIERVEWLLSRIFGKWWVEIKDVKLIANSVTVTIRLYVINPITGETEWQEGIGANPIQTDAGAGAADWNKIKFSGVQMAAPAAETYAVKDAAEKFGKFFGKDANRQVNIDYNNMLKTKVTLEDIKELLEEKMLKLTDEQVKDIDRVIKDKEENSYSKIHRQLSAL